VSPNRLAVRLIPARHHGSVAARADERSTLGNFFTSSHNAMLIRALQFDLRESQFWDRRPSRLTVAARKNKKILRGVRPRRLKLSAHERYGKIRPANNSVDTYNILGYQSRGTTANGVLPICTRHRAASRCSIQFCRTWFS